jgi:hypothetical protein
MKLRLRIHTLPRAAMAVALLGVLADAPSKSVRAEVLSASSSGYGLGVDISALVINLDVGPLPAGVSGSAPAPYNQAGTVLNVLTTDAVPLVISGTVSADAVNATATSNVDGSAGSKTTFASGGVVGAGVDVVTLPVLPPGVTLLGLDGTLSSTAQITGDFGSLVATGTTVIQDLDLVISGIVVDLSAFVNVAVAPNTSINLSALGILNSSLILNEQVVAVDQTSISVNAFHLSLGLLNITADVILGHSQAQVTAIPEPASIVLAGLGGLACVALRRRF